MTDGDRRPGQSSPPDRPRHPLLHGYCRFVDGLNGRIGWLLGPVIVLIAAAIVYEVVLRGSVGIATIWVSEAVVYGSSAVYLLAGGYALMHRRHVRIDLLPSAVSPRAQRRLELATFPFLVLYAASLVIVGGELAWTSFTQSEGTGTPWNPPIWPIKACIPIAGLLLLLQAFSNLFHDLGYVPTERANGSTPAADLPA